MRRLVSVTLSALAVTLAVPAAAAPVSTGRIASVRFHLQPADGVRLDIEVSAVSSSAGDQIEVAVERCERGTCGYPEYYAGPLAAGAVQLDPKTAAGRLRTVVGGVSLAVSWSPVPPGTAVVNGAHGGGTGDQMAFVVARMDPAAAHVVLQDNGCKGAGTVGDEVRIEVPEGAAGDTVPLRTLRLPAGPPVCDA
jgi:hypothetical protein